MGTGPVTANVPGVVWSSRRGEMRGAACEGLFVVSARVRGFGGAVLDLFLIPPTPGGLPLPIQRAASENFPWL
jgi:hypothetical protein